MAKVMISAKNVSKTFQIPHERYSSLKGNVLHLLSSRRFSRFDAVKDVSFDVYEGEFFGIVGRNGCGKSTLLKMLAGIYTTTEGSISLHGSLSPFIELGVGFNPELTARENVFMNGAILGLSRKQIEAKFDEIIGFGELEEFVDQKLKNFSSGMQVRLAFSIAIQADADIMLVDEVLAVGDANFQAKCFDVFRRLKKQGKTIVFVSHDMATVNEFCDRAIFMHQGEVMMTGKPSEIAIRYLLDNYQDDSGGEEQTAQRMGDQKAEITKIWLEDNGKEIEVFKNDRLDVYFDVTFKTDAPSPVPGVIIRNQQDLQVTASNSVWVGVKTRDYKAGETATFHFSFPNIFERGHHTVSANVFYKDERRVYDWRFNQAAFYVDKPLPTGGVVNPPYTFEAKQ